LVVAEHTQKGLHPATLSAINAAKKLQDDICVLVAGSGATEAAQEAAKLQGVSKVLHVDAPAYQYPVADQMANLLVAMQQKSSFASIMGPVSSLLKDVFPRLAGALDVQPLTDVMDIKSSDTFVRPTYAGNAIATVRSKDPVKVFTVRPTSFPTDGLEGGSAPVEPVTPPEGQPMVEFVKEEHAHDDKPQLATAKTVVSGGRGLRSKEGFDTVLDPLCQKLNAAMGASRAAVDAGFVPNDMQVGQTGKVVAPDLYLAVGISGAIQHLAGMKDSKTIVAINKDGEAPIFQVADYGLVADLFEAVPEMTDKVAQ